MTRTQARRWADYYLARLAEAMRNGNAVATHLYGRRLAAANGLLAAAIEADRRNENQSASGSGSSSS